MGEREGGGTRITRLRWAFWGAVLAGVAGLLILGRAQAQWPWFSLWILALLLAVGLFSLPALRRGLRLSWLGVTLFTLTGVSLANLFLFWVETHRQRSERLEVRGVYVEHSLDPLTIGVGMPSLDVRLEGRLESLEHWWLDVAPLGADSFQVRAGHDVEMLRVRRGTSWGSRSGDLDAVVGRAVRPFGKAPDSTAGSDTPPSGASDILEIGPDGRRGTLHWGEARAPLDEVDPLLNRALERRLRRGVRLSELAWAPEAPPGGADDYVLTMVRGPRTVGRLRVALPQYRVVNRDDPAIDSEGGMIRVGDTLYVTSRASTWAFSMDRVQGLSRVRPPTAVRFVRRPRPTGWPLPPAEACGAAVDRCAVLAAGSLPPPQPHFDLGGFGLDTARYGFVGRLETGPDQARVVGAQEIHDLPYGSVVPVAATKRSETAPDAGYLLGVHRSETAAGRAIVFTVALLTLLMASSLLVLLGNPVLARGLRSEHAHSSAAWALLNLWIVFLGIRLVLGLRVAYAAPFYDRGADTAVGLWIAFALLLVLLGRWQTWTPPLWRAFDRWSGSPARLPPGTASAGTGSPALTPSEHGTELGDSRAARRARFLASAGVIGLLAATAGLVWQRPRAGLGIVVAAIGVGAWGLLGLFGRYRALPAARRTPLAVLTADLGGTRPLRTFAYAAAAAVVLALAIQAPVVGLAPIVAGLAVFGVANVLERTPAIRSESARAWILLGLVAAGTGALGVLFVPPTPGLVGAWAGAWIGAGLLIGRGPGPSAPALYRGVLDLGRATLSGPGWVLVLLGLSVLTFLNFQAIPPFVRFALVFMLFLLAVRAGLACREVLGRAERATPVARRRAHLSALGLLVIPAGVLLVFMLFDFGLGLVFFLPMTVTVLLAARIDRLPLTLSLGSAVMVGAVLLAAGSVLRPDVTPLREAASVDEFSHAFADLGNGFVDALRAAGLETPVTRATVRSLAATDPPLVEEALALAGPSEALFAAAPSLEQVWGGRAYAAAGWTGTGLAGTHALGRGVPTVVSYAENAFSVYVLSEHGALGGLVILLAYLTLLIAAGVWVLRVGTTIQDTPEGLAVLALTIGSVLWLVLPAAYVAASNLGLLPLTGQNMPFLGLNSWADAMLVSGIGTGVFVSMMGLDAPGRRGPNATERTR